MHRIDTAGHQGNKFVDADPAQGVAGTVVNDQWLNSVQEEIINVVMSSGAELDKAKQNQLDTAIRKYVGNRVIRAAELDDFYSIPTEMVAEGDLIALSEDGRFGNFVIRNGTCPTDTRQGIFVSLSDDLYAERLTSGAMDTRWFGISDVSAAISGILDESLRRGGAVCVVPNGQMELSGPVRLTRGATLIGSGGINTFSFDSQGSVLQLPSAVPVAVVMGADYATSPASNKGITVEKIRVNGLGLRDGVGFSTNDTTDPDLTTTIGRMDRNAAKNLDVGFRYRNCWQNSFLENVSVNCNTGHLIDGVVGGTATRFDGLVAYTSDVGFDISVTGFSYSSLNNSGVDGARIGLKYTAESTRGFSIRNFGIENLQAVSGYAAGIVIDHSTTSGYFNADGVLFGAHDDANIIFIDYISGARAIIANMDITSSELGSCNLLQMGSNAGFLTFKDSRIAASGNLGDLFHQKVHLQNVLLQISGLAQGLYVDAAGGTDYGSTKTLAYNDAQAGTANKQIFSSNFVLKSSTAGADRFFGGVPVWRTEAIPDYAIIRLLNGDTGGAVMGIRTDDYAAGSDVVRDPAMSTGTTIRLEDQGSYVDLQKRPDGKLYQVAGNAA